MDILPEKDIMAYNHNIHIIQQIWSEEGTNFQDRNFS